MSGGRFNYDQDRIGYIAYEIERLIETNNDQGTNQWGEPVGRGYTDETISEFRRAIQALRTAEVYAQRIDWLVSGDDSEDAFHRRLTEDLDKLQK